MTLNTNHFGLAPEVAVDKLNSFATGFDVAEFLASQGIQGCARTAKHCPIAEWLTTAAPLTHGVWSVGIGEVVIETVGDFQQRHVIDRFKWEAAPTDFVHGIDGGPDGDEPCRWPSLLRKERRAGCDCPRCDPTR